MILPPELQERIRERDENVSVLWRIVTVAPALYTIAAVVAGGWAIITAIQGDIDSAALTLAIMAAPTAFIGLLCRSVARSVLDNLDLCHPPEVPARDVR